MPNPTIQAFFKRLEGASQAFALFADNKVCYATKFIEKVQNTPIGMAREFVAGQLGTLIDGPVPGSEIVDVPAEFLANEPRLVFNDGTRPAPGIAVGMMYLGDFTGEPNDHTARLQAVPPENVAGALVFDAWLAVSDRSWNNYRFAWANPGGSLRFATIDFADSMTGADPVVRGEAAVLAFLPAWAFVQDWVARIETVTDDQIAEIVARVPAAWLDPSAADAMRNLLSNNRDHLSTVVEAARP